VSHNNCIIIFVVFAVVVTLEQVVYKQLTVGAMVGVHFFISDVT